MLTLGSVKGPGPSSYDTAEAKNGTLRHFPAFTIASKKEGAKPSQCLVVISPVQNQCAMCELSQASVL